MNAAGEGVLNSNATDFVVMVTELRIVGASVGINGAVPVSEYLQERTPVIFVEQSLVWSEIDGGGGSTATAPD